MRVGVVEGAVRGDKPEAHAFVDRAAHCGSLEDGDIAAGPLATDDGAPGHGP